MIASTSLIQVLHWGPKWHVYRMERGVWGSPPREILKIRFKYDAISCILKGVLNATKSGCREGVWQVATFFYKIKATTATGDQNIDLRSRQVDAFNTKHQQDLDIADEFLSPHVLMHSGLLCITFHVWLDQKY